VAAATQKIESGKPFSAPYEDARNNDCEAQFSSK